MISLSWPEFRSLIDDNGLNFQRIDYNNNYTVISSDGGATYVCIVPKSSPASTDQTELETRFAALVTTRFSQTDTDGASIVRNKAAKKGWTFCSLPVEFQTSRLSDSLYSKDASGTDRSFITLKAYDGNGDEVTTPGTLNANYANIVKTVIDFEPPYDYEVIGGDLRTLTAINSDIRLWLIAAPDVAAPAGSKEMGGGINLRYLAPGNVWSVDGRVTKYATYNATYHTSKIRLIFKYDAGVNENIQIIIQFYRQ